MKENPKFDKKGICHLKDDNGDDVILWQDIWQKKISKPERGWIAYNFEKIKETVKKPDTTRQSTQNKDAQIYYKICDSVWLNSNVRIPSPCKYMAVVIQREEIQAKPGSYRKFVKTFYATNRIKK